RTRFPEHFNSEGGHLGRWRPEVPVPKDALRGLDAACGAGTGATNGAQDRPGDVAQAAKSFLILAREGVHAPCEDRPILHGKEATGVRPVFKDRTLVEKSVEPL